ncbi:MAG TPA: glucose-6-phosphate isomerase, partial [Casimicrobiaceae bacterium]|nr:glucose-6-phosphate isomerase [Casimicrobiaceae bacterium]
MSTHAFATDDALARCARALAGVPLRDLFAAGQDRVRALAWTFDDWYVDCSKERIDAEALGLLVAHARARDLNGWIAALFAGERVNVSEARPALHTALRQQDDAPVRVDGVDVIPNIRAVQSRIREIDAEVRSGARRGATGAALRDVVNIGIGGSDLGPRLVCDALAPLGGEDDAGVAVHFVSNVDPEHLSRALAALDPAATLFVVTSKTFTTQETLANARSARRWLADRLPAGSDLSAHFVAVTSNVAAAEAFGVAKRNVLPLWDFVGGRYSLWSSVGLAIVLRLGYARFAELLAGAASVDTHFRTADLAANVPALLGMIGYWNARHLGHAQRVVAPYAQALAHLPQYLQQLVLESNGKRVKRDGSPVEGPTAAALWGGIGTDSQHAFFQWLHQGTHAVPVEFIVPVRPRHPLDDQQTLLVGNALAQAQALFEGRSAQQIVPLLSPTLQTNGDREAAIAARVCPGDRASTVMLMPDISAYRIGQLFALYEHRTFVEAVLFGINPFDQFGVELGKTLAGPLIEALRADSALGDG